MPSSRASRCTPSPVHAASAAGGTWRSAGVAAALVLAFGSVLPASQAQAAIVYSGPLNLAIPATTAGLYLDVVTGVTSSTPADSPDWDVNLWGSTTLSLWANNRASPNDGIVNGGNSPTLSDNLALGTLVNAAKSYGRTNNIETVSSVAFLLNSSANYLGFRFLNESTGVLDYGWMQLRIGSSYSDPSRAIVGYAYENTGAGIRVGDTGQIVAAVPEPSSVALAGLALLALGGLRRR